MVLKWVGIGLGGLTVAALGTFGVVVWRPGSHDCEPKDETCLKGNCESGKWECKVPSA